MKCSRCDGAAFFRLSASGHLLCESHFLKRVRKRVKKTIRQNTLLSKRDTVLLAMVSGAKGALCARMLHEIMGANPNQRLLACPINAPENRRLCIRWGIELADGPGDAKDLFFYAENAGATKMALCDSLDDTLSQALFCLSKGDIRGLKSLAPSCRIRGIDVIRPLCDVPDDEAGIYAGLESFAHLNECPPQASLIEGVESRHPGSKLKMRSSLRQILCLEDGLKDFGDIPGKPCERDFGFFKGSFL